jgi:hypothetical protein
MRGNRGLMLASVVIFAAGLAWAQKPGNDSSKATGSAPPTSAGAGPAQSTKITGPEQVSRGAKAEVRVPAVVHSVSVVSLPTVNPAKRVSAAEPKAARVAGKSQPGVGSAAAAGGVVPVFPSVFWPSPMAIRQGDSLADALPGATADVAGAFIYTPALSYLPPKGECAVSIAFNPADPRRYLPAYATVSVTVR